MLKTVIEVKKVTHDICDRCHTDISESGSCVCDELSRDELEATQMA